MMHVVEALKLFELPETANGKIPDEVLKKKYRKLVKEWHPDVSGKDKQQSELMMAKINEAFELLSSGVNAEPKHETIVVPVYTHGATVFDVVRA